MRQIVMIVIGSIFLLCFGRVSMSETAVKLVEIEQSDGSVIVQRWTHDTNDDFVTEISPVKLKYEEKELTWKGETVVEPIEKIRAVSLFHPKFEKLTFEKHVTWFNGRYNVIKNDVQITMASNKLLIILLCIITFGMLLWNIVTVELFIKNGYDRDTAFGMPFIYNALIFIIGPIGMGIAAIILRTALQSAEGSLLREFLEPIGLVWLICFPLGISWVCLFTKSFGIISRQMDGNAEGVRSVWSKIFLVVLMVAINASLAVISVIVIFDPILIEWILYLAMCFICLPMSIILAGVTINSLKAR